MDWIYSRESGICNCIGWMDGLDIDIKYKEIVGIYIYILHSYVGWMDGWLPLEEFIEELVWGSKRLIC